MPVREPRRVVSGSTLRFENPSLNGRSNIRRISSNRYVPSFFRLKPAARILPAETLGKVDVMREQELTLEVSASRVVHEGTGPGRDYRPKIANFVTRSELRRVLRGKL